MGETTVGMPSAAPGGSVTPGIGQLGITIAMPKIPIINTSATIPKVSGIHFRSVSLRKNFFSGGTIGGSGNLVCWGGVT